MHKMHGIVHGSKMTEVGKGVLWLWETWLFSSTAGVWQVFA